MVAAGLEWHKCGVAFRLIESGAELGFNRPRYSRYGRIGEEEAERQFEAQRDVEVVNELHCEKRMSAYVEEVIVNARRLHLEHLRPHTGNDRLQRRSRGLVTAGNAGNDGNAGDSGRHLLQRACVELPLRQ